MRDFDAQSPADPVVNDEELVEPLFKIDGRTYGVPVRFTARQAANYITTRIVNGPAFATAWALEQCFGTTGLLALTGSSKITDEHYNEIVATVQARITGDTEGDPDAAVPRRALNKVNLPDESEQDVVDLPTEPGPKAPRHAAPSTDSDGPHETPLTLF